jgi:predicted phage terminase large subunit-like protein
LVEDILAYCRKRKYQKFVIEANQFQAYLVQNIQKKINEERIYVHIEDIINSSDKNSRIMSLQPFVSTETIRFAKKHNILIEQLRHFPKGAHDDGPDALEMAFRCCKESTGGNWYPLMSGGEFCDDFD